MYTKENEMESVRQTLVRTLKRANSKLSGSLGCESVSYIDLPFSVRTFKSQVLNKLNRLIMNENFFLRDKISVLELKQIFGDKASVFIHPNASTQQRIIGNVKLLYRPKVQKVFSNTNCRRYIPGHVCTMPV